MIKYKTFRNLIIMLIVLIIPATLLFAYANNVSKNVVQKTLEQSASKQLEFTMLQMEQSLRQLESQALILVNDSSVRAYASSYGFSEYINHLLMRKTIDEKLTLQSQADLITHDLTVYWPSLNETVSTIEGKKVKPGEYAALPKNRWFMRDEDGKPTFHLLFTDPGLASPDLSNAISVVETTFTSRHLLSVLQGLDLAGNGKSFFYFSDSSILANHQVDPRLLPLLKEKIALDDGVASAHPELTVLKLDNVEYLVQTLYSQSLNGTLISYIQLNQFLLPLKKVNLMVNVSLLLLFLSGVALSYLLYRHFRIPLGYLVRKIEQLGSGNYSTRAVKKTNNEFDYLFERFNDMASRIQTLIEDVYEEKVRTREAEYKHLQSQINPHFLYNCLFYIVGMAHKSPDAVVSMAKNLSLFYRHITRKAGTNSTFGDEIKLIESYLEVQSLRTKRLQYEISIPEEMLSLQVPNLILQPIVENAVIHGLEQKKDSGHIRIQGRVAEDGFVLTVEDDGNGLSEDALRELTSQIQSDISTDEIGCGLWNIHHRLINRFGPEAGLILSQSPWGGFRVTFHLPKDKSLM
ncbi:sensor histidine kinase [Gorillibacterium massiliense]|uniref:sensor histidine kinase n=1 Tax=Gorillibacterium massiliense TaxID=1280390 RepID=UPI0004B38DF5|nr:histidine kinase [Gorillibacterium massiliense]